MKKWIDNNSFLLALILVIGAIARLYGLSSSFINDELSAIVRLDHHSFTDLINYGVMQNDMHPAGIQVFLKFWSYFSGYNEFLFRLPFAIAGVLSLWMVYLLGKRWFNPRTGLIAAAILCFSQYILIYHQQARPYSPGMLFTLTCAYFWTKVLFDEGSRRDMIGLALSFALCMYTHYFAFLTAGIIGLTGLIFLNRQNAKTYLTAAGLSVLIFLPHAYVTFHHLSVGGLGGEEGWLGPPQSGWLGEYLGFAFNSSILFYLTLSAIILLGLIFNLNNVPWNKFMVIGIGWFALVFGVGYFYSIRINPILQKSILIFVFPFPIIVLSSFFTVDKKHITAIGVGVVMVVGAFSAIVQRGYYDRHYFGTFEELAEAHHEWTDKHGSITFAGNFNSPKYIHFYLDKYPDSLHYAQYSTMEENELKSLDSIVDDTDNDYFGFSWSTKSTPLLAYEIIRKRFPTMVDDRVFENCRATLFNRRETSRNWDIIAEMGFEVEKAGWTWDQAMITKDSLRRDYELRLSEGHPYSPTYTVRAGNIDRDREHSFMRMSCVLESDHPEEVILVYEVHRDGEMLMRNDIPSWYGRPASITHDGGVDIAINARMWDDHIQDDDTLRFYLWYTGGEEVTVDDLLIVNASMTD